MLRLIYLFTFIHGVSTILLRKPSLSELRIQYDAYSAEHPQIMNKRSIRNYTIAAVTGGFLGLHAFAIAYSLRDVVNFSVIELYGFRLPLLTNPTEEKTKLYKEAQKLIGEGSSLSYQKAFWDHGLDGIGAGAGVGILVLLSITEIRKRIKKYLNSPVLRQGEAESPYESVSQIPKNLGPYSSESHTVH